ncbi:hypothetical protein P7C73_g5915, partial [Tremellales sp. Uapishka_1]
MATAYHMETPSRVLRRVQQLEDMEMPSLPSIQHDIDYESGLSGNDTSFDHDNVSQISDKSLTEQETPHPFKRSHLVPRSDDGLNRSTTLSPNQSASTSSPFPPRVEHTPSPYVPTAALTSTPHSKGSRSLHERTRSGTQGLGSSGATSNRERWQTPGELSRSFEGEEIRGSKESIHHSGYDSQMGYDGVHGLGDEKSIPLNDASVVRPSLYMWNQYNADSQLHEQSHSMAPGTPITRRLSQGHVLLNRPKKREPSGGYAAQSIVLDTPSSVQTAIYDPRQPVDQERIPSLSRSDLSVTDSSGAASTPEGPMRVMAVETPGRDGQEDYEYDEFDVSLPQPEYLEEATVEYNSITYDTHHETADETPSANESAFPSKSEAYSPVKQNSTSYLTTPGIGRQARSTKESTYHVTPGPVLQDVTASQQNTPIAIPFTPSPSNTTKSANFTTPRPLLDDAERRKNHVLAVLNSTGLPSRVSRTPHPLRKVSMAPHSESIAEEGSPHSSDNATPRRNGTPRAYGTPGTMTHLSIEAAQTSGNDSFVSIASSADLTSDRRASNYHQRLSRGNTSFPTLLLPSTSPGGSFHGAPSDKRVDGAKIHKHLNAMNKQLLEANGELAREAEAWRDEVDRLKGVLTENGIEVEEVELPGNVSGVTSLAGIRNGLHPLSPDTSIISAKDVPGQHDEVSAKDMLGDLSPHEYALLLQEMAERLESLEDELNEKDGLISKLEERLSSNIGTLNDTESSNKQLGDAESIRMQLQTEFATKTEEHAKKFGEICSGFEDQVQSLEKNLGLSRAEVERLKMEKERLSDLISAGGPLGKDREFQRQIDESEAELRTLKAQLHAAVEEVETVKARLEGSDEVAREKAELEAELEELRTKMDEMDELHARLEELESLSEEMDDLRDRLQSMDEVKEESERLKAEIEGLRLTSSDQEAELERQYDQIQEYSQRIQELESDLKTLDEDHAKYSEDSQKEMERMQTELEDVQQLLASTEAEVEILHAKVEPQPGPSQSTPSASASSTSAMDRSMVNAMEERLDEAYREIGRLKHDLAATPHRKSILELKDAKIKALEREKAALADRLQSARSPSIPNAESPFKPSPFVHRAIASLKTPKTPGPLKDTTVGDANESLLQAHLDHLQTELQNANAQLDENFNRLEAAGVGSVALAEKLAEAQDRIARLEQELAELRLSNTAIQHKSQDRLEREREIEAQLTRALETVHEQMTSLKQDMGRERERLSKDNSRLNDLVSELRLKSRAEIESFRGEIRKLAEENEDEVRIAKSTLAAVTREKEELKKEFKETTQRIQQLERELANQRRSYELLSRQPRLSPGLAEEQAVTRALQQSLDETTSRVHRLEKTLQYKETTLAASERRVESLLAERQKITSELIDFDRDLRNQRVESGNFGRELVALKRESEGIQRIKEKVRGLEVIQGRFDELSRWKDQHDCDMGKDDLKRRFKAQSKDLAGQIRYLKAKFTREASFRNGLALQKRYLLLLVGGMGLNEQATLQAIASMGFPIPEPPRQKRSLKAVSLMVVSLIRARNSAKRWKSEVELKSAVDVSSGERRRVSARN